MVDSDEFLGLDSVVRMVHAEMIQEQGACAASDMAMLCPHGRHFLFLFGPALSRSIIDVTLVHPLEIPR